MSRSNGRFLYSIQATAWNFIRCNRTGDFKWFPDLRFTDNLVSGLTIINYVDWNFSISMPRRFLAHDEFTPKTNRILCDKMNLPSGNNVSREIATWIFIKDFDSLHGSRDRISRTFTVWFVIDKELWAYNFLNTLLKIANIISIHYHLIPSNLVREFN